MRINILNFWLSCIREQDIQKTSLDGNLTQDQIIRLDDDAALLSNQRDSVKVSLGRAVLDVLRKEKTRQFYRNNKDSRPVFFFPLITINNQTYPLFYVDLVDIESQLVTEKGEASFEINPWSIDTKIGVVTDTFAKLGYDEEMIDLSDSVINFIEKITGQFTLNFQLAITELLEFITTETKNTTNRYMRVTDVQNVGIIKYSDFSEATLIFKKDLLFIKENKALAELPIINDYLLKKNDGIEFVEKPFLGAFFRFPISKGQAIAVSEVVNSDRSIVSVQGGPGTGKTTMILSCISSLLTRRALSIAKGEHKNDAGFYLVTSFTNKAVDNVVNIINEEYGEKFANWLCLPLGNKDKRSHAIDLINRLINQIEVESFNRIAYEKLRALILRTEVTINNSFDTVSDNEIVYTKEEKNLITSLGYKGDYDTESIIELMYSVLKPNEFSISALISSLSYSVKMDAERLEAIKIKNVVINEDIQYLEQVSKIYNVDINVVKEISEELNLRTRDEVVERESLMTRLMAFLGFNKKPQSKLSEDIKSLLRSKNATPFSLCFDRYSTNLRVISKLELRLTKKHILKGLIEKISKCSKTHSSIDVMRLNNVSKNKTLFEASLHFLYQDILRNKEETIGALRVWSSVLKGERVSDKTYLNKFNEFVNVISRPFPVLTCTLSSLGSMFDQPESTFLKHKPFEVAMCDESGIVPIFCMPSILMRSKKALVIGDQKQLSVIINIDENRLVDFRRRCHLEDEAGIYDPVLSSAFQRSAYAADSGFSDIGESVILDEHRRCLSDIANCFIDIGGYKNITNHTPQLEGYELEMYNKVSREQILLVDVQGGGTRRNTNSNEIDAIGELLDSLEKSGIDLKTQVGIITPFQNQSILLQNKYRKRVGHNFNDKKIGTVHAFQGAEYDIVILSMVAYNDSFYVNFISKAPNLLNVAISRARNRLIIVGDRSYLQRQSGNITKLLSYVGK